MSDAISPRTLDPEGVPDGDYVLTVAGGHVTGLKAAAAGGGSTDPEVVRDTMAAALVAGTGITLMPDDAADTITIAATGGGAGGGGWATALDLPLTTLTGWGASGGTWTADANGIHRTDATGTARRYYSGGLFAQANCVVECDVRLDSGAGNAGLALRVPTAGGGGGLRVDLRGNGTNVTAIGMEQDATTALGTYNLVTPIAYGTWITFRLVVAGGGVSVFINGTLLTNVLVNYAAGPTIGLVGYTAAASWRNLTLWTPTLP